MSIFRSHFQIEAIKEIINCNLLKFHKEWNIEIKIDVIIVFIIKINSN